MVLLVKVSKIGQTGKLYILEFVTFFLINKKVKKLLVLSQKFKMSTLSLDC